MNSPWRNFENLGPGQTAAMDSQAAALKNPWMRIEARHE
jgi:hypothetical protein